MGMDGDGDGWGWGFTMMEYLAKSDILRLNMEGKNQVI